jgi:hypothetical protein
LISLLNRLKGKRLKVRAYLCVALATCAVSVGSQTPPTPSPAASGTTKILFVGNSFTYYNNLPATVAAFATAAQNSKTLKLKEQTVGGATLEKLWSLRTTTLNFTEEKWDFVVLQEQSHRPIDSPEKMLEFARKFDTAIKANGAKTLLYLTWNRQGTPEDQKALNASYARVAAEIAAPVAPVGPAWKLALELDPKLSLYASDGRHPSPTGSFIAACTIFLTIFVAEEGCAPIDLQGVSREHGSVGREAALKSVTQITAHHNHTLANISSFGPRARPVMADQISWAS